MQSKIIKKLKSFLSYSLKLFILTSFFLSQSFIAEIFLYQNNPNTKVVNTAQANYSDSWYNQSFLYRKQITIPRSINSVPNVPHTDSNNTNPYLSNFPVLISTTIPTNKLRPDHNDIIFTNQAGTQPLTYEIESYDTNTGNLVVWVKLPQLNDVNNTTDTSFYMYYDNNTYTDTTTNVPSSVWDSDFKTVWHLKETGTGASGDYKDSTSDHNNSTSTANEPTVTTSGKIGNAQSFNGTSNYITIPTAGASKDTGTISLWVQKDALNQVGSMITTSGTNQRVYFNYVSGSKEFVFSLSNSNVQIGSSNPITPGAGAWSHIVGVWNNGIGVMYVNGQPMNGGTAYTPLTSIQNPMTVGSFGGSSSFFSGYIDEVRISDIPRSADWIKTEYNNENSPSGFYNLGGEESYTQYSTPPAIAEVTPVPTPTNNTTPSYTFSSNKSGAITYGGDCSSATASAVVGNNTVAFNTLSSGVHSNCTIQVTDILGNQSSILHVTGFTIDPNVTWYNVFWPYRRQITIDHTKVPHTGATTNLTNFPVFVSITNDNSLKLSPAGKITKADGSDIIFVDKTGTQELNYEIESYDGTNGNLTAWVKVPTLYDANGSQDSIIYMYYGNSNAPSNTQTNINGVWDSGFKGVWHLNQDPSGTDPQMKDSTGNHNDGTSAGSMSSGQLISGEMGNALSFDGNNDYINRNITDSLKMTNAMTASVWFNFNEITNNRTLFTWEEGNGFDNSWAVWKNGSTAGFSMYSSDSLFKFANSGTGSIQTGTWYNVQAIFDGINIKLYLNGNLVGSNSFSSSKTLQQNVNNPIHIGLGSSQFFNGSIDEVRLSDIARSADWAKTEYNNQSSPNTFYNLGGEESYSGYLASPVIAEVTPAPTPTNNSTPSYTFSSTKPGTITYDGDCSSATTSAVLGNNTVTFNLLSSGTHSNCTIQVTDELSNQSNTLAVTSFTVNNILTTYVVPAVTDNKILPKSSVSSSYLGDTISTQISNGEYKAASFVVNSNVGVNSLLIETSNLSGNGIVIPSSAVDIKTVKCWYQGNYGTNLSVTGRYLTPDLLLKDDSLVNVDGDTWAQYNVSNPNGKNYLKLTDGSYIDISSATPQRSGVIPIKISDRPVRDAATLQPVNLSANYNKQFWITLHIPDNTPAGSYTGTINLKNGAEILKTINVNIQVLPIVLPLPNIEYSLYYYGVISGTGNIGAFSKTVEQYTAEIQDMQSHGVINPNHSFTTDSHLLQQLSIRQQAGMDNTNFYNRSTSDASTIPYYKNLTAPYGVKNIYLYGPDENPVNRDQISSEHSVGGMHFNSEYIYPYADSAADILDLLIAGNLWPDIAAKYHSYGHKLYLYNSPQTAPNNPRLFRMNYGLELWQNDYDGEMAYAYQSGVMGDIWNDFDNSMRDHVFAYPTMNGVIDTTKWEGFREGVNDMRYLAALQNAITTGNQNDTTVIAAKNYLANLKSSNLTNQDLDAVRSQTINYTLAIMSSTHPLTVNHGTGTGFYKQGNQVAIVANTPPANMVFNRWIGDTQYVSDINAASAIVTMPSYAVSLTAMYISPWYNNSWSYRKTITIDHTKVSNTDQPNFPVLISLTDLSLRNVASGGRVQNIDGNDIIFTLPNRTLLNYEIESYDNSTGKLVAWVKIPNLSASADTVIYVYYGNSNALANTPSSTWDSDFKAVWHLNQTGTGAAGDYKDSTTNHNDSTNTANQPTYTSSSPIGGSQGFNGTSTYINMGAKSNLVLNNAVTVSAWVKINTNTAAGIAGYKLYNVYSYGLHTDGGSQINGWYYNSSLASTGAWSGTINNGTWYYVTTTFQSGGSNNASIYINGALKGQGTLSGILGNAGEGFFIGDVNNNQYFNGYVDEVRISDMVRSQDWIQTEYNNESSPSTFYTTGTEETILPPTITSLTANLPNGTYGTGTTIPITVNFSKDVTSTGNITLTLNTTPERSCSFTITNNNSATCNYTIQGGDSATNLNATISGTIHDQFNNLLTNFTPLSNLSDNTTININTSSSPFIPPTKPNITTIQSAANSGINIDPQSIPSNITQIAISLTPDFKGVSWIDFDRKKFSTINQTTQTLYIKFRTNEGAVSDTIIITPQSSINNPISLIDGDIIQCKSSNDPNAVYIVKKIGTKTYIRHITSIQIFNYYKHLKWENLKQVDSLTPFSLSSWIRVNTGTNGLPQAEDKVYEINGDQTKHWINMTASQFLTHGGSDEAIYTVNTGELNLYSAGADVVSL